MPRAVPVTANEVVQLELRFPSGGMLIPTASLPDGRLAIVNPELKVAERYGGPRATGDIDPYICGSYQYPPDPTWTLVPRGALDATGLDTRMILHPASQAITDARRLPKHLTFSGTLRPYQQAAVDAASSALHGIIVMPPGAGKTVTSLAIAAKLGLRPLVLVHTHDLMQQWIDSSTKFLGYPLDQIGGGKVTTNSLVGSVAMVQTITEWPPLEREALAARHGVLLVDECHHAPARTIMAVLWNMGLPRRFGVSATPDRADGLTPILFWSLGPIIHRVSNSDLVQAGVSVTPKVVRADSDFDFVLDKQVRIGRSFAKWGKQTYWSVWEGKTSKLLAEATDVARRNGRLTVRMVPEDVAADLAAECKKMQLDVEAQVDSSCLAKCYKAMCVDEKRIELLVNSVRTMLAEKRKVLVLAGRVAYCQRICEWLAKADIESVVMTSRLTAPKRKATLALYKEGAVQVCIATSLADEGLDVPDISGLILAFPGRSEARTIQRVGRTMRSVAGKQQPVIIDIVDNKIGMFVAQWAARRRAYKAAGCQFGEGSDNLARRRV